MKLRERLVSFVLPGRESMDVGSRLWRLPAMAAVAAGLLAAATLTIDQTWLGPDAGLVVLFSGNADTARSLLTVIATSTATLTALVFTILTIVIQLASSQYSPRALPAVYQDLGTRMAIGTLIGTFTYLLIVLQALRASGGGGGGQGSGFVPGLSVTTAFGLALVTIGAFVVCSNHIAHAVRVTGIVERISRRTADLIEELYPDRFSADGEWGPDGEGAVRKLSTLAPARTLEQDVAYGFRVLVDIAERGLSPAVNDPTTAVQVLDRFHDFLRRLARRRFPPAEHRDADGEVRLIVPVVPWRAYVELACAEIRHYGADSIQVHRRMRAMLEDLLDVAPTSRRSALADQLEHLDSAARRVFPGGADRTAALRADRQGLGGA